MRDIQAAILWFGHATRLVVDDEYDDELEPEHVALVCLGDRGGIVCTPVRGFKRLPNSEEE